MKFLHLHIRYDYSVLLAIAAFTRLWKLGSFPPGGENAFWLRLPTAIAAVSTILLLTQIVNYLSGNRRLAVLSGAGLIFMPWHFEQSRVNSPAMLGLAILLAGVIIWIHTNQNSVRLISLIGIAGLFRWVYPQFWLFGWPIQLSNLQYYLGNLFKLISVDFLFFKNDAFWIGGIRTVGVMLTLTLPVFILGVYKAVFKFKLRLWPLLAGAIIIWLIAAANPTFPEEREFFLITPYLALITAFGTLKLFEYFKDPNMLKKVFLAVYAFLILYNYILFLHTYTAHYSKRIEIDMPQNERLF